jgi:hypothetical protein
MSCYAASEKYFCSSEADLKVITTATGSEGRKFESARASFYRLGILM